MKEKRAQVAIFVIVGILIAAAGIGIFYGKQILEKAEELSYSEQAKSVKSEIQNCIDQSATKAISLISRQGGFVAPDLYFSDYPYHVAYWYMNNSDVSPSVQNLQSEMSWVIIRIAPECIYIIDYEKYGVDNYTIGNVSAKPVIQNDLVFFSVDFPFSMSSAGKSYFFRDFSTTIKVGLGKVFYIAKDVVAEQASHPDRICWTCMTTLGMENDVVFDSETKNDTLAVRILDNSTDVFAPNPFEFKFAMKV